MTSSWDTAFIYLAAIPILIALLWPLFRAMTWRLFRFDKEVSKILEQKKSSEVRLGQISETLAPVLQNFPLDIHKKGTSTVFIGQPIDYIHIDPEEGIFFIEVKSGNAKLSSSQRKIKALVQDGCIEWLEFRVK